MTELEVALKKRETFLKENPQMREYQNLIDRVLEHTRQDDRLATIITLMQDKQEELLGALNSLKSKYN